MPGIFISYRRDDSEGYVGRLYEDLVGHFGNDAVFMDVATIKAGRDFRRVIDEQVSACGVLLVVMGRNWLEAKNEAGQRRLDLPTDAVRLEIAAALRRDIPVIPVLVQGARMPAPERLPADLSDLAYRNAAELTHPRWTSDVELLIKALEGDVGSSPGTQPAHSPEVRRNDVPPVAAAQPAGSAAPPTDKPLPPAASNSSSRVTSVARSRGPLIAGVLAAVAAIGGGGIYFWHDHNVAIERAEQAAQEEAAKRAAAEKAEADRIAALKAKEEEQARAEAARLAAEKAAADAAALEKALQEAAQAKAEAERLAADVRREKLAAETAAKSQTAAALAAAQAREREAAEARERAAAAEARARDAAAAEARARDAAAAEARARQAAEKQKAEQREPPAAPSTTPLTAWLPLREFFNLRQSQPKGQDFPYAFQAGCAPNEPFRVRGRFGANPVGVNRLIYGAFSAERYQEANSARTAQGYKLYSRQSVSCPVPGSESKTIWVAAVWVQ